MGGYSERFHLLLASKDACEGRCPTSIDRVQRDPLINSPYLPRMSLQRCRGAKATNLSTVGLDAWPNGDIVLIGVCVPRNRNGNVGMFNHLT